VIFATISSPLFLDFSLALSLALGENGIIMVALSLALSLALPSTIQVIGIFARLPSMLYVIGTFAKLSQALPQTLCGSGIISVALTSALRL